MEDVRGTVKYPHPAEHTAGTHHDIRTEEGSGWGGLRGGGGSER